MPCQIEAKKGEGQMGSCTDLAIDLHVANYREFCRRHGRIGY